MHMPVAVAVTGHHLILFRQEHEEDCHHQIEGPAFRGFSASIYK